MIVRSRNYVSFSTIGYIHALNCFSHSVSCDLSASYIEEFYASVHACTDELSSIHHYLWDWVSESFDDLYRMIGIVAIVPESYRSIIAGAYLNIKMHTITLLSGLNRTEFILEVCPVYLRIYLPYTTSVKMTFLSPPPVMNLELSLLISSEYTS